MTEIIQPPVNCGVTQTFGNIPSWDPNFYKQWGVPAHNGIDYGCEAGTAVAAALTGKINKVAFEDGGFGQYAIQDGGRFWLYYCHLNRDSVFARVGETVRQGRAFCYSGWTGAVYPEGPAGAHLHWGKRLKVYDKSDPWKGWRNPFEATVVTPEPEPVVLGEFTPPVVPVLPKMRVQAWVKAGLRLRDEANGNPLGSRLQAGTEVQVFEVVKLGKDVWFGIFQCSVIGMRKIGYCAALKDGLVYFEPVP